jgi:hypothetical protein
LCSIAEGRAEQAFDQVSHQASPAAVRKLHRRVFGDRQRTGKREIRYVGSHHNNLYCLRGEVKQTSPCGNGLFYFQAFQV